MKKVMELLHKVKYFGLRKLYYLIKNIFYSVYVYLTDIGIFNRNLQQSVLKRRICRTLIEDFYGYWGHGINKTQYFLGLGLVHYAFVRNTKPRKVLCIGSKQGFIPAILALACKDNGFGTVDFIDAGFDESDPKKHWGGTGYWRKSDAFDNFRKIGIFDYIKPYIMTTDEFAKIYSKRRYQYIYIDGDHSYEGVKKDYKHFWPKLTKGGFLTLHDVVEEGYLNKGLYGVRKFWNEIADKHAILFPIDSGLGIIQKS